MSSLSSVADLRRAVGACDRFEKAFRAGAQPRIEDYLTDDLPRNVLLHMLVKLECELRLAAGETPSPGEYLTRFPTDATVLYAAFADSADTADAVVTPEFVGGYELLDELGCGGMGIVYRARQPGTDRVVAVKLVRTDLMADPDEMERRFATEAKSAALEHPHIVPVYAVGRDSNRAFIVMRLIEGRSLSAELKAGPMTVRRAAEVVAKIADAVRHAHAGGVLHRDLKPSNVLTDAAGEPYVTDFGLALRLDATQKQTPSGAMLGTPHYMAPEQATDAATVGPAADVYALGATLYHCLTGRTPFESENVLDTLRRLCHEEPTPPRRLRAGVSRDLDTICLRCLEKLPWQRYPSAEALAKDLQAYLNGEPIRARPRGPLERAWRWCWRHPAQALGAITVAALIVAGSVGYVAVQLLRYAEELEIAKAKADASRHRAEVAEARQAITAALNDCNNGEIGRGVLRLMRVLETAPADACEVRQAALANIAAWGHYLSVPLASYEAPGRVFAGAFRPDGQAVFLVTEGRGKFHGHLVEPTSGRRLAPPCEFGGMVRRVAFRPGSRVVATAGPMNLAQLWDTETGRAIGTAMEHNNQVNAVAFRHDGLLATGSTDRTVKLWNGITGESTGMVVFFGGPVRAVVFSPDGSMLAVGGDIGPAAGEVRMYDVATGQSVGSARPLPARVTTLAYSPDGATLLAGCSNGTVRGWNERTGEVTGADLSHGGEPIGALEFTPDGRTLLAGLGAKGTSHGGARLWDVATWTPAATPLMPRVSLSTAAMAPDGRRLLLCGFDSTAWLWEAARGLRPEAVLRQTEFVSDAVTPDGRVVLTRGPNDNVRVWDALSPGRHRHVLPHGTEVLAIALSGDGRTAATGGSDGIVRVWDVETGRRWDREFVYDTSDQVHAVALCPAGRRLLAAGRSGPAKSWDLTNGAEAGPPLQHPKMVQTVAFAAGGHEALTGCHDGAVRRWDVAGGRECGPCLRHATPVRLLTQHSAGGVLAGTSDGLATAWHADGRRRGVFAETGRVTGMAVCGGGATAIAALETGVVQLWQTADGTRVGPALRHGRRLNAVAACGDGRGFLTASGGEVALWPDLLTPGPATASLSRRRIEACACTVLDTNGTFRPLVGNDLKVALAE